MSSLMQPYVLKIHSRQGLQALKAPQCFPAVSGGQINHCLCLQPELGLASEAGASLPLLHPLPGVAGKHLSVWWHSWRVSN